MTNKIYLGVATIIIIVLFAVIKIAGSPTSTPQPTVTTQTALPGLQTSNAPWAPEISSLRARLDAMGLPALSEEGTALHIHQHLDIFIDGKAVAVPEGIGINETENFISDIHTHDTTGVIHVESPTIQTFTLGQFFDIWGVRFTQNAIGGYVADTNKTLRVFVNGTLFIGDPRTIALDSHQEIAVVYAQSPKSIPTSYQFPDGE